MAARNKIARSDARAVWLCALSLLLRAVTLMNEVVREFLLETNENLAQLDLDLVTLEKSPTERETLARVFRTLHTVKGTAGFLGLPRLQAVSHAAENLLSRLRSGELIFNADIASGLLA